MKCEAVERDALSESIANAIANAIANTIANAFRSRVQRSSHLHGMSLSAHPAYRAAYAARRQQHRTQRRPTRRDAVLTFLTATQNRNTSRAYASGMRQFERWASETNAQCARSDRVDARRPQEHDVAAYMQYMVETQGLAMSTVNTRVNAVSDSVRYDTTTDYHPTSGAMITQMRAVLVPMAQPKSQKREITRAQLYDIVAATRAANDTIGRRDACMLMLAFTAFLRVSEVVRMNRGDITFTSERVDGATVDVMRVHVDRMCKNDRQRLGHERLVAATGAQVDMVHIMREYLRASDGTAATALFTATGTGKRLALSTPAGRLRVWLEAVGVTDAKAYGFHSMRAGGATHAARAGVAVRHIKAHGNWKSDAVNAYVRANVSDRLRASDALSRDA